MEQSLFLIVKMLYRRLHKLSFKDGAGEAICNSLWWQKWQLVKMIVDFLDNSIGTLSSVPKSIFQDTDDSNRCWDDRLTSILIILRTETKDIICTSTKLSGLLFEAG